MKFSLDRKYLATSGEDGIINIWEVDFSEADRQWNGYFFKRKPLYSYKGHTVDFFLSLNMNVVPCS